MVETTGTTVEVETSGAPHNSVTETVSVSVIVAETVVVCGAVHHVGHNEEDTSLVVAEVLLSAETHVPLLILAGTYNASAV